MDEALDPDLAARLAELEEERVAREARIRELEGRLALSRAENDELALALTRRRATRPTETVRLGSAADDTPPIDPNGTADQGPGELPEGPVEDARGRADDGGDEGRDRPVLRLYGERRPAAASDAPPLSVPTPPPGVSLRIPVRSVTWDPRTDRAPADVPPVAPRSVAPATRPAPSGEAVSYRAALGLLTDRRYPDAVAALTRHVDAYPDGRFATSAVYWRGEAYYALRRYDRALVDFRRVLRRGPGHRRAPEALYKVALCLRHRGDRRAADEALRMLKDRYPGSPAARMLTDQASQEEDAS